MKKYIIFFLLSVLLYSAHFFLVKHGIYGDGNGYFALAHTLFFQSKPDFAPVYRYLSEYQGARYIFSRVFWNILPTSTGVLNCPWLIGTAIFWLPSFFLINTLSYLGARIEMFNFLYEYGCGISGIIFLLAGLYLIELQLKRVFHKRTVWDIIIAIFLGSQLLYYSSFEPALSHQISFFLISSILYLIQKRNNPFNAILLGFSVGLLIITRIGDSVLIFLPLVYYWIHALQQNGRKAMYLFLLFIILFVFGILPQLLLQKVMYGSYLYNPYVHAEKGSFHPLLISSVYNQLFSSGGGFLLWSPLYIFAIAGFFVPQPAKAMSLSKLFGISLLIYTLFISSWEFGPPSGFGNRFFVGAIPFLAYGLANFFTKFPIHLKKILIIVMIWNFLLLFQFFADRDRLVKRHGLTLTNLVTGQVTVPFKKALLLRFLIQ